MRYLLHIPRTGGTSLLVSGIPGGHHISYEKGKKYITLIRNPIDRTISHFLVNNEKNDSKLDSWEINKFANFQTNWLMSKLNVNSLSEIKKILSKDFIVCPTNKLNELMKYLNLKPIETNKRRREYKITDEEIEKIRKLNQLDSQLYEFAQKEFDKIV